VPAPDGRAGAVTRAIVPGGGEVALLHGAAGAGDPRLAEAAAAAAALALDSARLEAAVRATPTRGLRGLADRVEASGGTLTIDSPHGGPTTIRAELQI
jgi:hypothetical protein